MINLANVCQDERWNIKLEEKNRGKQEVEKILRGSNIGRRRKKLYGIISATNKKRFICCGVLHI